MRTFLPRSILLCHRLPNQVCPCLSMETNGKYSVLEKSIHLDITLVLFSGGDVRGFDGPKYVKGEGVMIKDN